MRAAGTGRVNGIYHQIGNLKYSSIPSYSVVYSRRMARALLQPHESHIFAVALRCVFSMQSVSWTIYTHAPECIESGRGWAFFSSRGTGAAAAICLVPDQARPEWKRRWQEGAYPGVKPAPNRKFQDGLHERVGEEKSAGAVCSLRRLIPHAVRLIPFISTPYKLSAAFIFSIHSARPQLLPGECAWHPAPGKGCPVNPYQFAENCMGFNSCPDYIAG